MPRAAILALLRALVLIALAVSAALLFDYVVEPTFCTAAGEGCATIRASSFARVLGVPTPVLGVTAFVLLFALSFLPHERRRTLMVPIAVAGGLFGLGFLGVQWLVEHAFCNLCVVVDLVSIVAGLVAIAYRIYAGQGDDGAVAARGWAAAGLVVLGAPILFAYARPTPPVKPAIERQWVPGKINIVELSDFECPFCRVQHHALAPAMDRYGDRIHFVRITVALPTHPHSRSASCAYVCARDQAKGEPMADELFSASDLSAGAMTVIAGRLAAQGLNRDEFSRCMADPRTDKRVTEEYVKANDEIGFRGLPTIWIGSQMLEGSRTTEELSQAIARAQQSEPKTRWALSSIWFWSLLVTGIVGLGIAAVRSRRQGAPEFDARPAG